MKLKYLPHEDRLRLQQLDTLIRGTTVSADQSITYPTTSEEWDEVMEEYNLIKSKEKELSACTSAELSELRTEIMNQMSATPGHMISVKTSLANMISEIAIYEEQARINTQEQKKDRLSTKRHVVKRQGVGEKADTSVWNIKIPD